MNPFKTLLDAIGGTKREFAEKREIGYRNVCKMYDGKSYASDDLLQDMLPFAKKNIQDLAADVADVERKLK